MTALPDIGLGTWQNTDPEACIEAVRNGLECGYRHVDTAQFYHNEEYVGEGIARASVDRDDIVVATKVHPEAMGLAYDEVIDGAIASLERLGLDYLDILYVHWPVGNYEPPKTLAAFDELVDRGRVQHVGLSNFSIELLDEARSHLDTDLFAHQVEMHPLLHQTDLHADAVAHDHTLVAYSPLARGEVFDVPEIVAIADDHDVSAAQVSLAWLLAKENVCPIPKATSEAHLRDNFGALNLELDAEEIERIDAIDTEKRYVERENAPWRS